MPYQVKEKNDYRFAASTVQRAKDIILTPTKTISTEERWSRETEATANFLSKVIPQGARVFDYGCGIGRVSKALLDRRADLRIVGVDTTADMRCLALEYVGHPDRFTVTDSLKDFPPGHFEFGFAIYAMQHVRELRLKADVALIGQQITGDGKFYLLDSVRRWVPEKSTIERMAILQRQPNLDLVVDLVAREVLPNEKRWLWKDDGIKVADLLRPYFNSSAEMALAPDSFAPEIIAGHRSILFERD